MQSRKVSPDDSMPQAEMEYVLKSTPNYASRSGSHLFVPLLIMNPIQRSLPANAARVHPLHIPLAYSMMDTLAYTYPPGYEAENLPKSKRLESPYGTYELVVEPLDVGHLRVIRKVVMQAVSVLASQYPEVRQFYLDVMKLDNCQAVLVRKG